MTRILSLILVSVAILTGCGPSTPPPPTAAEIAAETVKAQKVEATRNRIKSITQMGDSMLAPHEKLVTSGLLSEWVKMNEQSRAVPFLYVLAQETDDDAMLCLMAAIASEEIMATVKKQESIEGTDFMSIAELSKEQTPLLAKMAMLDPSAYQNAKLNAQLLNRKH